MASKRKKPRAAKIKVKRRKAAKLRKIGERYASASSRELLPPLPSPV